MSAPPDPREDDRGPPHDDPRRSEPDRGGPRALVARFPDRASARDAVERLSRLGVDGARMSRQGPAPAVLTRAGQRRLDLGVARRVRRSALRGAARGAAVGGVFGGLVFALATPVGLVTLAGVAGGAAACGWIGLLAGAQSNPTMAPVWEQLSDGAEDAPTTLTVVVRDDAARLSEVLTRAGADLVTERR